MAYASVEMHYAYYHIPALLSSRFVTIDKLISPNKYLRGSNDTMTIETAFS